MADNHESLREYRRRRGWSLEQLSYIAGIHEGSLSKIERGLEDPRRDTVVRLARAFNVSVARMVAMIPDPIRTDDSPAVSTRIP
jgi:transcriptional regulator with XRE-family HTH domain